MAPPSGVVRVGVKETMIKDSTSVSRVILEQFVSARVRFGVREFGDDGVTLDRIIGLKRGEFYELF